MSAAAVVITGGYFAYQEFGPKPKPAASSPQVRSNADTAPDSHQGSATPPDTAPSPGSAGGSATGSAEHRDRVDDPAAPSGHKALSLELPRLIGLTPEKASAELTRLGFDSDALQMPPDLVCNYEDEKRDLVPVGAICNQERSQGSPLMSDAKVRVVVEYDTWDHGGVHAGAEWHRMPNVIGMPLAKAQTVLRAHGFVDEEFAIGEARSSCGKGLVCEQVPKAGIRKFAGRPGDLNLGD